MKRLKARFTYWFVLRTAVRAIGEPEGTLDDRQEVGYLLDVLWDEAYLTQWAGRRPSDTR